MAIPLIVIELGILGLDYLYHRYVADQPKPPQPSVVTIPTLTVGSAYPLVWGQTRVRAPIFAWASPYGFVGPDPADTAFIGSNITFVYTLDMFLVLGIGFDNGVNHLISMWTGDVKLKKLGLFGQPDLSNLSGNGNFENWSFTAVSGGVTLHPTPAMSTQTDHLASQTLSQGVVEFLNGNSSQQVVDSTTHVAKTDLGRFMINAGVDATRIPGFRGFLSAFLYNVSLKDDGNGNAVLDPGTGYAISAATFAKYQHWLTGANNTQVPAYSFEVASYARSPLSITIGVDANIVDVIYDVICGTLGKLGLPSSLVNTASFSAAGIVLYAEGNGYSRTIEQATSAKDLINELCAQADAVLYVDPVTGLICIKLVRFDYDPNAVLEINVDNCEDITNLVVTSWTGTPNRIRLTYTDRGSDYKENSVWAANQANAVGQNGDTIEQQLAFPGVMTYTNAVNVATRELAARSRPIAQCQAVVGRQFYNTVPGDVVAITWPDYGWVRVLFRVAGVNRGTLADGRVKLSLVQEYFNVNRGTQQTGGIASGPATGVGGAAQ